MSTQPTPPPETPTSRTDTVASTPEYGDDYSPQTVSAEFARELERELSLASRPWRVVLTTPIFERHECEVVDVGHADKILTVNCASVDAELTSLRRQLEEAKAESDDNYEQGRKKGAIESGNGDLMRAHERLRLELAERTRERDEARKPNQTEIDFRVKIVNLLHDHGSIESEKIDEMVKRIVRERDEALENHRLSESALHHAVADLGQKDQELESVREIAMRERAKLIKERDQWQTVAEGLAKALECLPYINRDCEALRRFTAAKHGQPKEGE